MPSGPRHEPVAPSSARRARRVSTPLSDPGLVAQCRAAPESGPSVVFLSGGSALREVSRTLKHLTHNSVHLITPFDSGGSSAPLRAAFGTPSVGDLRNRLLALADDDMPAAAEIQALFGHRLPKDLAPDDLQRRLDRLVSGEDPLTADAPGAPRRFAQRELARFAAAMPAGFDLRDASVGNLVLTGRILAAGRLDRAIAELADLLGVRGTVLPTVDVDLHLEARLEDGTRVRGQHRITGKEEPPPTSPVREVRLIADLDDPNAPSVHPAASESVCDLIRGADLICFPMGSFYSSLVCNLLPVGIGRAISQAACPKLYVPGTGHDPELGGADPAAATARLLEALRADAGADAPTETLLDGVLLDARPDVYAASPDRDRLEGMGVAHRTAPLVLENERDIDAETLAGILVSIAQDPAVWRMAGMEGRK